MDVLVTGCSSGIGRASALHLAGRGHRVRAGVRRTADAPAHPGIEPVLLDVTDPGQVAAAAAGLDRLDAVVNNAGTTIAGPLEHLPLDRLREQLEVNTVGTLAVTQAVLPALRASGGRVVTIGSVGGMIATPFLGAYSASKLAVEALMDTLRRELRPWGVPVVLVEPVTIGSTRNHDTTAERAQADRAGWDAQQEERYGAAVDAAADYTRRSLAGASSPQEVAAAVERALTVPRPRARYLVGANARSTAVMARVLPTRLLDAAVTRAVTGAGGR